MHLFLFYRYMVKQSLKIAELPMLSLRSKSPQLIKAHSSFSKMALLSCAGGWRNRVTAFFWYEPVQFEGLIFWLFSSELPFICFPCILGHVPKDYRWTLSIIKHCQNQNIRTSFEVRISPINCQTHMAHTRGGTTLGSGSMARAWESGLHKIRPRIGQAGARAKAQAVEKPRNHLFQAGEMYY